MYSECYKYGKALFKIVLHHTVYLSGKYFLVKKQLHTGLNVKQGRWVYRGVVLNDEMLRLGGLRNYRHVGLLIDTAD